MVSIKYAKKQEFEQLKQIFDITDQEVGFTITVKNNHLVVICDEGLTCQEKNIVLQHELAHTRNIDDEEQADIEALKYLTIWEQELLIKNWLFRHGHAYVDRND
jgi:DNA-directed RNA polymerase specialized sigma subunit